MRRPASKITRVLAIDPTSRGLGFAVLESQTQLVDSGMKYAKSVSQTDMLSTFVRLVLKYSPNLIITERAEVSRRCERVRLLLGAIKDQAKEKKLRVRCFSIDRVKKVFGAFQAQTKQEIAQAITQQLPALAANLPRPRKPWTSEHYQMAAFDAVALALSYFYSRRYGKKAMQPDVRQA